MINPFIQFLKADLNAFIVSKIGAPGVFVEFANLNNITQGPPVIDKKIIISIVNIEEDKMLKSPDNYIKINNEINYKKPPVWLNIICLFTFFTRSTDDYDGIDMLGNVVQYFQSKPKLDPVSTFIPNSFPAEFEEIRSEFVSLNYEQTNYLWGLFGGSYHPSVIYKFKTIPIDNLELTPGGPAIQITDVNAIHKK